MHDTNLIGVRDLDLPPFRRSDGETSPVQKLNWRKQDLGHREGDPLNRYLIKISEKTLV